MSATARETFDDEFQDVDARVGSVLGSAEQCVQTIRTGPPNLPAIPPPRAAAWLLDQRGHLDLTAIDPDVGWRLAGDLCRVMRMLPVWEDDSGRLTVAVEHSSVALALKVLERHPRTRGATSYDFLTVSGPDISAAIDLVHGRPAARGSLSLATPPQAAPEQRPDAELDPLEELWVAKPVEHPLVPAVEVEHAPELEELGPIGARLVSLGVVSQAQVDEALALQQRFAGRLGELLVHEFGADEVGVAAALAGQLGTEFVERVDPDPEAIERLDDGLIHSHRVLPLSAAGGELRLAMVDPLDDDAVQAVRACTHLHVRPVMVTESAFDAAVQAAMAERDADRAVNALLRERPEESARTIVTKPQKVTAAVIASLGAIGLLIDPIESIIIFNIITVGFYLTFSAYRLKLIYNSLARGTSVPVTNEELAALDQRRLPTFTLLIPLYHEAAIVDELVAGIERLTYPKWKLDVKLLCEADDGETIEALRRLRLPPHFHVVVVPNRGPRTKPKACNYGLARAHGELIVIYDAEDRPDRDQLMRVVAAFVKSDPHVVCVQCKLNYYNQEQNVLTRWFTTEYSMWFDLFLPGLDSVDAPIPLGGTSNHFVTERLRTLGGWDPYNVTEDADLGIRLSRSGYSTMMIDSTTYEEANPLVENWVRQRSRWVKGYIQTWLVHMRHPVRLERSIGWRRFWSFQFVVAGTFIGFLLNPLYWTLTTLWVFTEAGVIREIYPSFLYFAAAIGLYIGNFVFVYINAAGAMWRGYDRLVKYALLTPLYWGLMSVAAWKGLFQLITKPHYWEKTVHGLANGSSSAHTDSEKS